MRRASSTGTKARPRGVSAYSTRGDASNAVFVAGRLPRQASEIVAAFDHVIDRVGEDELRRYRTGLRHL